MTKRILYPEQIPNQEEDSRIEMSHIFDAFEGWTPVNGWSPKRNGFIRDYIQTFQDKLRNFPYTEVNNLQQQNLKSG